MTTPLDAALTRAVTAEAERDALAEKVRRMRNTLLFYASEENWESPSSGFALQYDPLPSAITSDRGTLAADALKKEWR